MSIHSVVACSCGHPSSPSNPLAHRVSAVAAAAAKVSASLELSAVEGCFFEHQATAALPRISRYPVIDLFVHQLLSEHAVCAGRSFRFCALTVWFSRRRSTTRASGSQCCSRLLKMGSLRRVSDDKLGLRSAGNVACCGHCTDCSGRFE